MAIRVMIVEDSAVVRELLAHVVAGDPRLELVAQARSGEEALALLERAAPDVITMDVNLPGADGLETTRRIMSERPTPIVVVSAAGSAPESRLTIRALQAGALAVLDKPVGTRSGDYLAIAGELCRQLVAMSAVKLVRQRWPRAALRARPPTLGDPAAPAGGAGKYTVLGIASSTGGPSALEVLLRSFSPELCVPILLVQHITGSFLPGFATWLAEVSGLPVELAGPGQRPRAGTIYLAPADHHLRLCGERLAIDRGPQVSAQRPSATVLFESLASSAGAGALAALLTGMGDDGARGLASIRAAGGMTLAEDESTAVVYGMPKAAVALGAVCESLPLPRLGPRLVELLARGARAGPARGASLPSPRRREGE